jgi:hypothetical protein
MNLLMRKAIRRRLAVLADDRGSMPMVLLITMVGLALGAMMIPMVITQDHATTFDNRRVRALNAAESGFDVALGYIRAAITGTNGTTAKLPCTSNSALTGTVDGAGAETYSVTLAYYTQNPNGHTAAWLADPTNKMACVPGYGTYLHATDEYVPSYVLMTSTGLDTTGGNTSSSRTLQTTYIVQTSNTNISGGTIAIYPQSNGMCIAAAWSGNTTPPTPGTRVQMEPCETDKTNLATAPPDQTVPGPWPWQVWSYNADLSIFLVSSESSTYPNGLCLDVTSSVVSLQPCAWPSGTANTNPPYSTTKPQNPSHDTTALGVAYNQEWSIDDSSHLEGSKSDKSDINGQCLNTASQSPGTVLNMITCAGGTTDTAQTWVPSPDAGAGGAGATNNQVVNFQQFGRCLDVTNQSVSGDGTSTFGGNNFVIAYTCKQDPDPTKVAWNQKFVQKAFTVGGKPVVELVTYYQNSTSQPYCLNSPQTVYGSNGPYVNVVQCPSGTPPVGSKVLWTYNVTTDSSGNQLAYADKFTVVDQTGKCLTLTQGSGDLYFAYSKTIVQTCDGSNGQKWNAQANVATPLLVNTIEK